jgi:hypothetical protein
MWWWLVARTKVFLSQTFKHNGEMEHGRGLRRELKLNNRFEGLHSCTSLRVWVCSSAGQARTGSSLSGALQCVLFHIQGYSRDAISQGNQGESHRSKECSSYAKGGENSGLCGWSMVVIVQARWGGRGQRRPFVRSCGSKPHANRILRTLQVMLIALRSPLVIGWEASPRRM